MDDYMKLAMDGQDDVCAEYAAVSVGTIEAQGSRYVTFNAPSGWFGRNSFIAPSAEELDGIVKEILANEEKGYPTLTAYAEEFQPENAAEVMESNGFSLFLTQTGMVFDLEKTEIPDYVIPEGGVEPEIVTLDTACVRNQEYLRIREKSIPEERLHEWTEVMTEGFKPEKQLEYNVYDNFAKSANVIMYASLKDGKIAGTAMLLLNDHNSGIHEVAVPVEHRHQKLATNLIIRILKDLKTLGRTEVSLQASPFGYPVYSAIGFQETCHIHTWKLQ